MYLLRLPPVKIQRTINILKMWAILGLLSMLIRQFSIDK